MAEYQFTLQAGATTRVVHPIWKKDQSLEYAYEQNQQFMRAKLTGNLIFQREDYDFIMAQSIETKIYCNIKVDWNHSGIFTQYWRGAFHLTDCTINADDKNISVKPEVEDRYNKVLASLDKEYDLIKLKPATQAVEYYRRPLLQIYVLGENIVNCYLGGMHWEQDINSGEYYDGNLREDYKFGRISSYQELSFGSSAPSGMTNAFYGVCEHGDDEGEWPDFSNNEDVYFISYYQYMESGTQGATCYNGLKIFAINDPETPLWEFSQSQQSSAGEYAELPSTIPFTSLREGVSDITANNVVTYIYGRMLLGRYFENAYEIPVGDIVADNRNYKYCYPYPRTGLIRTTNRYSTTTTQWGKRPDNTTYYLPPLLTADEMQNINAIYPIGQSTWEYSSMWLIYDVSLDGDDERWRTPTTLRDAYSIEGVLSALLAEIDPTVTFAASADNSVFLYGTNPLTNEWGRLVLTPKSNILVAEYSQPAQTAPIKLSEVMNFLKQALGCYWYIDDDNKLHIEHISFFKNGYSYSGTPSVGIDLTTLYNCRNGRVWALATSTYQYDKMDMPERYEYAWADDTTDEFKGNAIKVRSSFVQQGNVEEVNIAKLNSDIDYMLLNPSDISMDGFGVICCAITNGKWHTQFKVFELPITIDQWPQYKTLQNYQLAMIFLQPTFLISDMPSYLITVNNENINAKGIQRKKQQTVNIPMPSGDGDMQKLVKTAIGNGEIFRMTINLSSRMAKTQLRYDTV